MENLIAPKEVRHVDNTKAVFKYNIDGLFIICNDFIDKATVKITTRNANRAERIYRGNSLSGRVKRQTIIW